ncbi:MAG: membrane protein insertase YidC [Candidatus Acidiferrales bacterium]
MNDQLRAILFVVLALLILFTWSHFVKTPVPSQKPGEAQQHGLVAPQSPATTTPPGAVAESAGARTTAALESSKPVKIPVVQSTAEKSVVIESTLYRVELSNRGGVVRSWQLKKYFDDQTPPRPLDVVDPNSAAQLGWPLSVLLSDAQLEAKANSALYEITPDTGHLNAPSVITLHWSDGHLDVTKKLSFTQNYELSLDVSVTLDGKPLPAAIAWRGGFGDKEVYKASQLVSIFYNTNNKITLLQYKKLGVPGHQDHPYLQMGPLEFTGIEDQFFTAVFIPQDTDLSLWHWTQQHNITVDDKPATEPEAEMAAGTSGNGPFRARLFVGPKDLTLLEKMNPPLEGLINFGWTGIIAKPLFYALKWTFKYVPNYGWAIVLLTLAINLPLFPFKMMSWRSMQKMQKVAPEVRSIQDRYKKYSMNDPRKRKMNEEVMAVYSREGINPMMSCLPMLVQAPIWWALWRVLTGAIELRHAQWIWWIHDLSVKDPYYILPAAMAVTMYLMTKMTPQASADPTQQKMQTLMPLMFAVFFFTLSSGLNLYMFTSNLVGVGQQLYLNKTDPLPSRSKFKKKKSDA